MLPPLLRIDHLCVRFKTATGITPAVEDLCLQVAPSQTVAIVGESGSGKSVTALAVMGLLDGNSQTAGHLWWQEPASAPVDLLALSAAQRRRYRGQRIAMIFQEPMTSLNPLFRCGYQIQESIQQHAQIGSAAAKERAISLLEEVQLPNPQQLYDRYPHELSGGQLQRIMIAIALSSNPSLLIADEPTTALDVTVQAAILTLLQQVQRQRQMALMFISHDLGVVSQLADRVVVMYRGRHVEDQPSRTLFTQPRHPYTQALIACRPQPEPQRQILPVVSDFMTEESGIPTAKPLDPKFNVWVTEGDRADRLAQLAGVPDLLTVEHLRVEFPVRNPLGATQRYFVAVQDVSFGIRRGETLGLVGESGCGKTTLGRTLLGLIKPSAGQITFDGQNLSQLSPPAWQKLRADMQLVFQDPYSSLNPRLTVGEAIAEPLWVHCRQERFQRYRRPAARRERVAYLLDRVGLPVVAMDRFPHEFSGGQRQRICIARALALNPQLVVADEPVSALDVSVQAQVLNLLKELQAEFGLTYLFISHDLSVVKFMGDRIMVMNRGTIEELDTGDRIYHHPQSDYTRTLIAAIPHLQTPWNPSTTIGSNDSVQS
ncbi:MAG: ABC transporter ATP-binding protein [Oscillatoriales cyanobacterium SM2_2_1]|nr:ABC transporter ATP-binding protein [Oscillatoriales cyanobacterium SM2_2_1]